MKALKFTGIDSGHHLLGNPERFEIARKHILEQVENGNYKFKIDSTFLLSEVVKAYQRMETGQQMGKIIVDIDV